MTSRPYAVEEVLTFDRLKRAVTGRVTDAAVHALEQGAPVDQQKLRDLLAEEWMGMKETVRSSPAARVKAREYMERVAAGLVDNLINSDKGELENLGVVEKYL